MATIASVNINVAANVHKFQAGMKQSENTLRAFSSSTLPASKNTKRFATDLDRAEKSARRVRTAFGGLSRVAAGLGVAFSARALVRGFKETVESLDQLSKLSGRIGITTQKLAGLQFAGVRTGVSVADMGASLERFNRRTAEASLGTGEAIKVIQQLGLDAKTLADLPLGQRLEVVADRISGLSTSGLKANAAFKLFGDSGFRLLNFLNEGGTGIRQLTGRFDELNGEMGDSAQMAAEMADNFAELEVVIGRWKRELATGVIPVVSRTTEGLTDAGVSLKDILGIAFAPVALGNALEDVEKSATRVNAALDAVKQNEPILDTEAAEEAVRFIEDLRKQAEVDEGPDLRGQFQSLLASGVLDKNQIQEIDFLLDKIKSVQNELMVAGVTEKASADKAKVAQDAANKVREEAIEKLEAMRSKADQLKDSLRSPFGVFRDDIAEINELFKNGLIDIDQWQKAAEKLGDQLINDVPSRIAGVAPGSPAALEAGTTGAFSAINSRGQNEAKLLRATESIDRRAAVAEQLSRERNRLLREGRVAAAEIPG